ncbi:MAG: hypothetical protein ACYS0K_11295, partial [Planctomycetota bacterium]
MLDPVALQINEAEFKGTGRIADEFELTLDASGPIGALGILPVKGEGDFAIQNLLVRLAKDGPISLEGILTAAELQY